MEAVLSLQHCVVCPHNPPALPPHPHLFALQHCVANGGRIPRQHAEHATGQASTLSQLRQRQRCRRLVGAWVGEQERGPRNAGEMQAKCRQMRVRSPCSRTGARAAHVPHLSAASAPTASAPPARGGEGGRRGGDEARPDNGFGWQAGRHGWLMAGGHGRGERQRPTRPATCCLAGPPPSSAPPCLPPHRAASCQRGRHLAGDHGKGEVPGGRGRQMHTNR